MQAATGGRIFVESSQGIHTPTGAVAVGSASGVSAATGEGANITANSSPFATSTIASGATLLTPYEVIVETHRDNLAKANASTLSVGILLNVGAVFASATASGVQEATVAAGAHVGTASQPVEGLSVSTLGTDQSQATVDLSGGGAFSGLGGSASATTSPMIDATLLGDADTIGDVTVDTDSTSGTIANMTGASGGIVDVNESQATSTLEPWIDAS